MTIDLATTLLLWFRAELAYGVFIGIAWLFSVYRRAISRRIILGGVLLQFPLSFISLIHT